MPSFCWGTAKRTPIEPSHKEHIDTHTHTHTHTTQTHTHRQRNIRLTFFCCFLIVAFCLASTCNKKGAYPPKPQVLCVCVCAHVCAHKRREGTTTVAVGMFQKPKMVRRSPPPQTPPLGATKRFLCGQIKFCNRQILSGPFLVYRAYTRERSALVGGLHRAPTLLLNNTARTQEFATKPTKNVSPNFRAHFFCLEFS